MKPWLPDTSLAENDKPATTTKRFGPIAWSDPRQIGLVGRVDRNHVRYGDTLEKRPHVRRNPDPDAARSRSPLVTSYKNTL